MVGVVGDGGKGADVGAVVLLEGEERDRVREFVRVGYVERKQSIRALAQQTGRSYGLVHVLLAEAKVELRQRGGRYGKPESMHPWAVADRRRRAARKAQASAAASS
ncbi:hypothetical protein Kpho02_76140 [Kitasatospora phosalacinea]|uniref:Helix-turn-helix domain-containing protein n=1 Tax=Kitasatospora phosalacinea TaxID=2065 RepID=A0A9W6V7J5_9ACTN|nr:hypothetical protein Kpho02_76140 [Kitasatospora phosalacinea]